MSISSETAIVLGPRVWTVFGGENAETNGSEPSVSLDMLIVENTEKQHHIVAEIG